MWRGVPTTVIRGGEGGGSQDADGADVPTPAGRWFEGADVPTTVAEGDNRPQERTCPRQACGGDGVEWGARVAATLGSCRVGSEPAARTSVAVEETPG